MFAVKSKKANKTSSSVRFLGEVKGQLISKADWRAIDSPKKRTDKFDLFTMRSKKANRTNSSVPFLGEVSRP